MAVVRSITLILSLIRPLANGMCLVEVKIHSLITSSLTRYEEEAEGTIYIRQSRDGFVNSQISKK